jgi:hypothetical protein
MASDFTVEWQFSQKEQMFFLILKDQIPCNQTPRILTDLCQGYQMVYFQTKNRNLGKFWRA